MKTLLVTTGVSVPADSLETPTLPVSGTTRSSAAPPRPALPESSAVRASVSAREASREKAPGCVGTLTSAPSPPLRTPSVAVTPSARICQEVLTASVRLATMEIPSCPACPAMEPTAAVSLRTTLTPPALVS